MRNLKIAHFALASLNFSEIEQLVDEASDLDADLVLGLSTQADITKECYLSDLREFELFIQCYWWLRAEYTSVNEALCDISKHIKGFPV